MEKYFERHAHSILKAIYDRYKKDPKGFRKYLPEIAQYLERLAPTRNMVSHRSVLTALERQRLIDGLLRLLEVKDLAPEQAIQAIEYCATLVQDESLPEKVDHKLIVSLLRKGANIIFSKVTKNTRITVKEGEAAKQIAILRGVHLHLTWNDRLLAISVLPSEMKEHGKALKFVGIAKDTSPDVAAHHDSYFVEGVSVHGI